MITLSALSKQKVDFLNFCLINAWAASCKNVHDGLSCCHTIFFFGGGGVGDFGGIIFGGRVGGFSSKSRCHIKMTIIQNSGNSDNSNDISDNNMDNSSKTDNSDLPIIFPIIPILQHGNYEDCRKYQNHRNFRDSGYV